MSAQAQSWPVVFDPLRRRLEEAGETIVLSETWEKELSPGKDLPTGTFARTLVCGLVQDDLYAAVSEAEEDELGYEVSSSGPHPHMSPDTSRGSGFMADMRFRTTLSRSYFRGNRTIGRFTSPIPASS